MDGGAIRCFFPISDSGFSNKSTDLGKKTRVIEALVVWDGNEQGGGGVKAVSLSC